VQFSTRAVLELNRQTMERREEEVQKLVTKASGIITKHICDQIDAAMTEFPQLKTVCSNCLVQVVHSRERLVHKEVYDVISHFHKAVPARRRQIIDHTEVFQTLLFREAPVPPEWEEEPNSEDEDELAEEHGLERKKDPSYEDQRKHHKGNKKGRKRGRKDKKKKKPSPTAQFVKRHREGIKFALEDLRERGYSRVQAEDVYDAGANHWSEDEAAEIYWHLHKLLSRMPLDEERSAELQEVVQRLKIVLEDEEQTDEEDDSLALSDDESADGSEEPLPAGWEEVQDQNGRTYFWNKESDETAWDRPTGAVTKKKTISTKKREAKVQEDDGKRKHGRRRTRVALGDVDDSEAEEEDADPQLIQLDISFAKHVPTSNIRVMETRLGIPCYFMPLVTVNPPAIAIPEGMSMFFPGTSSQFRQVHFPLLDDQVLWQRRLGGFMAFASAYLWDRDNGMVHELVNVILQHLIYKLLLAFQRDVEQSIEIHSLDDDKANMLLSENRRILMKRNMLKTKLETVQSCLQRINSIE